MVQNNLKILALYLLLQFITIQGQKYLKNKTADLGSGQVTESTDLESLQTTEFFVLDPVTELENWPQFLIGWDSPRLRDHTDKFPTKFPKENGGKSYSVGDMIYNSCEMETYRGEEIMQHKYQSYLSGFDDDGRPIWIGEWGKYDLNWVTSGGQKRMEAFDNYTRYSIHNILMSHFRNPKLNQLGKAPPIQVNFIVDFEGLTFNQLGLANLAYLFKVAQQYFAFLDEYGHLLVVVNMNYVAEVVTNMFRPVLGRIMEKVQIFGTNKAKWVPFLRQNFPPNQLPKWYGGDDKNFKPIAIYGK